MAAVARATVARPPTIMPAPEKAPPLAKPKDDDACELDFELQARIDDLHGRMGRMTHYDVLGVARDTDKKGIKAAFYELAATLHPDRHFRKKLGPYKQKLNEVFARISTAYEALGSAVKRAEYDAKLPPLPRTPAAVPPPKEAPPTGRRSLRPQPAAAAPPPAPAPPPTAPDAAAAAAALAERRRAFAARLAPQGGAAPDSSAGRRPPEAAVDLSPGGDPQAALRRMFDTKVENAGRKRAKVFVDAAEEALAKDDVITAAAHYKLALECYDAPELRATFEAVDERAREKRFAVNSILGEKAEKDGRWEAAATYYGKAYTARRDGRVAERAAHAIQMQGGDLKRAVKLAEEAVLEAPQNMAFRLTLGEVYAAAGMGERAHSEAERVLSALPKDPRARALLAKAKGRG
jgi:curved DNA-binding protein CbpA